MTSFRRFIIAVAEVMQIISIITCTLIGGVIGGASGAFRSSLFGAATGVNIDGLGQVATVGGIVGFATGAVAGFVLSATLAGIMFAFAQIERNTRSLMANEVGTIASPEAYRETPRF